MNDGRSLSIKLHYTNEIEASNLEIDKNSSNDALLFVWAFLLNAEHSRIVQLDSGISKRELS